MLWKKNSLKSEEYEDLLKKYQRIQIDIDILSSKISKVEADFRSLRGRVYHIIHPESEEEEKEEPKTGFIKTPMTKSLNIGNPLV